MTNIGKNIVKMVKTRLCPNCKQPLSYKKRCYDEEGQDCEWYAVCYDCGADYG